MYVNFKFCKYNWYVYLLMQQSQAFKILRTRLKTVPSYSFSGEQFKRSSSGNPYLQVGSQVNEDGEMNTHNNVHNGMNLASKLQQFEQMQQQHRMHSKSQARLRQNTTSSTKVYLFPTYYYIIIIILKR